ncbi:MAG: pectate lyase [Opitutaceae bacterium]|nr:pectate lyase [Opitutaceae bacterium]
MSWFEGGARFPSTSRSISATTPVVRGRLSGVSLPRVFAGLLLFSAAAASHAVQVPPPLTVDAEGRITYASSANGDRVPDYSHAGYGGGGVPIPRVQARVRVDPAEGDDGARIQAAIDFVSGLSADGRGLRGAVQLAPGTFQIAGQLKIRASGVVLRGSMDERAPTVLVATGTDRRSLIEVAGDATRRPLGAAVTVVAERVPVGATRLQVAGTSGMAVGMLVTIERPSTKEWIEFLGMHEAPGRQPYQWKAGALDVRCDRVIAAIEGDVLVLDAPLTFALDRHFGGGLVTPHEATGYLRHVGVEWLTCESAFDSANPLDEQHAWNAIDLHAVRDGWVANITARHFAGSVVQVGALTARITVQDCAALEPVSEIAGYRRMAIHTRGQQTLFLRCRSSEGRNDFTTGYLVAGPTVFLECSASENHNGFSGSIGSWSTGILFDNVVIDGGSLRLDNLETFNQGVGWNAAGSMLWQSSASTVICRSPPGATNWACGVWGQFVGGGPWSQVNEFIEPQSLYRAQLAARLGDRALEALSPLAPIETRMAVPALEQVVPDLAARLAVPKPAPAPALALTGGWLTAGGRLLTGAQGSGAWWLGRLEPARASEYGPALTRFAPGRTGTGLTDEIPSVVARMVAQDEVAFRHHYGLWHERRRIDHQMIRRPDADVWPPFFEMPFARSGQGRAWDGLSRYDLTRYNPWYFARVREFAAVGREQGRVLIHETYFQHNILESGAHWVDSPWRPVNNINATGFTEPPPFDGDTIKMAAEFYDVSHPVRRELHRAYMRQCLAALADEPNVIHTLTAENSGPLPFMQFWLDVVAEWERETGKHPLIALSAPKDVQDAILADPTRAAVVDVIDLTYWFRTETGGEFAPPGGTELAPRQHARLWKGGRPSARSIAGMVREYRARFPQMAVISNLPEADGWMFAAAGGSFPKLPRTTDPRLLAALASMVPTEAPGDLWILARSDAEAFVVAPSGSGDVALQSHAPGRFLVRPIDLESGAVLEPIQEISTGEITTIGRRTNRPAAFWLVRNH